MFPLFQIPTVVHNFFEKQLSAVRNAICSNCYILGDFNLDARMSHRPDYLSKFAQEKLENFVTTENLIQVVNFDTWSRTINGLKKSSLLDHVYVKDIAMLIDISYELSPLVIMFR